MLRNRGRTHKQLTTWPSPATVGIPSNKACVLNSRVLEILASWWTQENFDSPRVIPIAELRCQATCMKILFNLFFEVHYLTVFFLPSLSLYM